jgi:hypothetical protein
MRCICGVNMEKKKWMAQWIPVEFMDEHLNPNLMCVFACPVCGTLKVDVNPERSTREEPV